MVASDAELQSKLAQNAKAYAIETYDIQVMLDAYEQLYDDLSE